MKKIIILLVGITVSLLALTGCATKTCDTCSAQNIETVAPAHQDMKGEVSNVK